MTFHKTKRFKGFTLNFGRAGEGMSTFNICYCTYVLQVWQWTLNEIYFGKYWTTQQKFVLHWLLGLRGKRVSKLNLCYSYRRYL